MSYRRQRESDDKFARLMQSKRTLFVHLGDDRVALLCHTKLYTTIYIGTWTEIRRATPRATYRIPPAAFYGHGWNLFEALELLEEVGVDMAKIDLREAPRDELDRIIPVEKGSVHITLRDQKGNVTFRQMPDFTHDIRRDIWNYVFENPGCVVGQIAKGVGRKKSPWLIAKVNSMVDDGYLIKQESVWRNGFLCYRYEVLHT